MSNLFERVLSGCVNVVGCLGKLCCLLFSISAVIGHFSSNWPGSSSRTIRLVRDFATLKVLKNQQNC